MSTDAQGSDLDSRPADPDDVSSNPSGNRPFAAVAKARLSRRDVLRGGALASAMGIFEPGEVVSSAHASAPGPSSARGAATLGFTPVAAAASDRVSVPPGYTAQVLIPWGTPIQPHGPRWRKDASNSAAEQARQVGTHHDGMHFFPLSPQAAGEQATGLLVVNHEYTDPVMLYADGGAVVTAETIAKGLAALGVTVIGLRQDGDSWRAVGTRYNRRITGATPVTYSGPVGPDHPRLRGAQPARGTLNNCSNGVTPWGTYLTCEENFNIYFGTADPDWRPSTEQARYGISAAGQGYRWHEADPRFDVAKNPDEPHRFGWVVEIDPFGPRSVPVKRTALGRFKHEGAVVTEAGGHVVVYSGDDQDGDYIYKFVSAQPWRRMRAAGRSPLDHGTLYVARFDDDGTGRWLPLTFGRGPLTPAGGWRDQADVLLRTRQAADALGATPLDRPEWIAVHPHDGRVYASLTNGSGWPGAVTPRRPNYYGHIIRWHEAGGAHTARTFEWDIFLLAGDPLYDPQTTLDAADVFGSPDGLWFDPDGRLWIQTDVGNYALNDPEWGQDRIGNNAMLAADPVTGEIRRFLVGPRGCEISGISLTPDGRTLFVNVQHPGEATPFWGEPTAEQPRVVSNWPDFDPQGRPRSATVAIRRVDGGRIGT